MNEPEYIVYDEMAAVAAAVGTATGLDINYQQCYITELNETLTQWENDPALFDLKFPIVYLAMPYTITRGIPGFYGRMNDLRIFIIHHTDGVSKYKDRLEANYKQVIYPIYRALIPALADSPAFDMNQMIEPAQRVTERPYWGEDQKSAITDKVDVLEISGLVLNINNNINCS